MASEWEQLNSVNTVLNTMFLCVPPYRRVTHGTVAQLHKLIKNPNAMQNMITEMVKNPSQRAYQMEYRFKKCDIFTQYMPVLEYATYDMFNGNWICAYLSMLPIVEAVLRKWAEINPELSFEGMRKFSGQLSEFMHEQKIYSDERKAWADSHINYLSHVLTILYQRFDEYKNQNFATIFNRNLTLHKLDGVSDMTEGLQNLTRIMLVLDVIAELYLMQNFKEYWEITFNANPRSNSDYQLRWALYKKWSTFLLGFNDVLLIPNVLLENRNELEKLALVKVINNELEIMLRIEKDRFKKSTEL